MAPANLTHCLWLLSKLQTTTIGHGVNSSNSSSAAAEPEKSEIHALLYIVVTLLFYSLGIVVGIISYLKREKREIEEDRMYDSYIASRQDPVWSPKYEKVQQVISRLQVLENEKLARLARQKEAELLLQSDHLQQESDNENSEIEKTKLKRSSRIVPHFSVKIRDFSDTRHTLETALQKSSSQHSVSKLESQLSSTKVGSSQHSSSQNSVDNLNKDLQLKSNSSLANSPETFTEHLI